MLKPLALLVLLILPASAQTKDLASIRKELAEARALLAQVEAKPDDYENVPETTRVLRETIATLEKAEAAAAPPTTPSKAAKKTPPKKKRAAAEERKDRADRAAELRAKGEWKGEPPSIFSGAWEGKPDALARHGELAVEPAAFTAWAGGRSLDDVRDKRNDSGGPPLDVRYVFDPADPSRVIDMRHFAAAAGKGRIGQELGFLLEVNQLFGSKFAIDSEARKGLKDSAMDPQDFYSNALGEDFGKNHYRAKAGPLGPQLDAYFEKRREMSK